MFVCGVQPFSPIYNIIWDNYIDSPNDYALLLLNPRPPQVTDIEAPLFDALTNSIEQLVFFVTDIMVCCALLLTAHGHKLLVSCSSIAL